MPSIFEKIDEPLQLFEGTYISESDPTVTTILVGLSFPTHRLLSLEKNKDRLRMLVKMEYIHKYDSQVSWASDLKTKNTDTQAGPVSSKLNKYQ